MKDLDYINESVRGQIQNFERLRREVKSLYVENRQEYLLKEKLNEYFLTSIADLMSISDFIFEASFCMNEADINMLLETSYKKAGENHSCVR